MKGAWSTGTSLRANVERVAQLRSEAGATTPRDRARERVDDARPPLIEAMRELDRPGLRDLHVRLGQIINELDDLGGVL